MRREAHKQRLVLTKHVHHTKAHKLDTKNCSNKGDCSGGTSDTLLFDDVSTDISTVSLGYRLSLDAGFSCNDRLRLRDQKLVSTIVKNYVSYRKHTLLRYKYKFFIQYRTGKQ